MRPEQAGGLDEGMVRPTQRSGVTAQIQVSGGPLARLRYIPQMEGLSNSD